MAREARNKTLQSGVLLSFRKSSRLLMGLLICVLPPCGSIVEGPGGHSLQKDGESWADFGPHLGGIDIFVCVCFLGLDRAARIRSKFDLFLLTAQTLDYIRAHGYPRYTRRPAIPGTQVYPAPGAAALALL